MKKTLLILSLSIFLLVTPRVANAQSVNMSISPPVVEVLIAPNVKTSQTFNLQYQGTGLNIIPALHLVKPSDENGNVSVDPKPVAPSAIPLTVTSVGHPFGVPITTEGSTIPITLTFEAATTDIVQDVYLALVLSAVGKDELATSSPTTPAISALILVTINPSGVMPINLDVQNFSPPFFHDSWLPLSVSPTINNHIPIMIRPEGKYDIISPSGKTLYSLPLYPNLILGNSSRIILGSNKDQPPIPLTWSPKWYNFGPHRLRITITTQGGTKLTEIEKVIWIIPIRIVTLTTLFIILIIIFIATRRKSRKLPIDT